jgi:FAD-dependent urate hydroxylase
MMSRTCHVAIIGAGPYGLAAAAHLKAAGIHVEHFGRLMDFWKNHMPAGMLLRSPWNASHISDPGRNLTLDDYPGTSGIDHRHPLSLEKFIQYGRWFQQRVSPDLDERQVVRIENTGSGFRLVLNDGEWLEARRAVVATGIASFAYRPSVFDHVPLHLASHSSDHQDLKPFAGKEVVVVGGGQSALESAALLKENGATVDVVVRANTIRWLHGREILRHSCNPIRKLLFHPTDVGPPLLTQISARPEWFQLLPPAMQPRFAYRCIRPAGAAWLMPRMKGIRITTGRRIVGAAPEVSHIVLRLDDGSTRRADYVFLATGYRVDIMRHRFLAPISESIRCSGGYPELGPGFESSIPGLHFLGAPAAVSFGPLMRFVSGTAYSAAALARYIAGHASVAKHLERRRWRVADMHHQ